MPRQGAASARFGSPQLATLSDEELLGTRLCDLGLQLAGSGLEERVAQLYSELERAGFLHLRPEVSLGDEWFSPDGVPAIAVPFWLTHRRLRGLERRFMREVEGGTDEWCMRLLRHEAGHCFDHAYQVSRQKKWRDLFGDPRQPYDPDRYAADPTSRDFVTNLEDHYAQAHPEEDFAETFAVVLDPKSKWRRTYARRQNALAKLQYVDDLIRRYGTLRPIVSSGPHDFQATRMRRTLGRYYLDRLKANARRA